MSRLPHKVLQEYTGKVDFNYPKNDRNDNHIDHNGISFTIHIITNARIETFNNYRAKTKATITTQYQNHLTNNGLFINVTSCSTLGQQVIQIFIHSTSHENLIIAKRELVTAIECAGKTATPNLFDLKTFSPKYWTTTDKVYKVSAVCVMNKPESEDTVGAQIDAIKLADCGRYPTNHNYEPWPVKLSGHLTSQELLRG